MSKADYEYMIREDKKCQTCTRMTVSQDEYISGLEEQYAELKQKYDELNDFSNSQLAKVLKENEELKKEIEMLNKRNIAVQKAIFDSCL